jgi:hypothetical protein
MEHPVWFVFACALQMGTLSWALYELISALRRKRKRKEKP